MRALAYLLLSAVVLKAPPLQAQQDAETRVLTQANSPVLIYEYEGRYQEGGRYSREGIRHDIKYRNTTDRGIRAVKFGLLSFNIFNEFLHRTAGIAMNPLDPGGESSGALIASALADFSFFTGVTYVAKVRFLDGEVWEADEDEIVRQIREIEDDFDAAQLRGEGGSE